MEVRFYDKRIIWQDIIWAASKMLAAQVLCRRFIAAVLMLLWVFYYFVYIVPRMADLNQNQNIYTLKSVPELFFFVPVVLYVINLKWKQPIGNPELQKADLLKRSSVW